MTNPDINEDEIFSDVFDPNESDLDYFLRRRTELGVDIIQFPKEKPDDQP